MAQWLDLRLLVIAACGASAGVHAGLVPDHYRDSRALGVLFGLAGLGLATVAAALAVWPEALLPVFAAAGLFLSLIAAYVAAGEPVDALGIVTKTIEVAGLALTVFLLRRLPTRPGDLALAYFGLTFVLAFIVASATGHG